MAIGITMSKDERVTTIYRVDEDTYFRVLDVVKNVGSARLVLTNTEADVIAHRRYYKDHWLDRGDLYWLWRLMQEVFELALALNGLHKDDPLLELRQIASICINWMEQKHRS